MNKLLSIALFASIGFCLNAQNISTVVGDGTAGFSGDGGAATAASLKYPEGVAIDISGNIYIADQSNNRIRKVTASTGVISTVAGNGTAAFSGDGGLATSASINGPSAVAVDAKGNIYIADKYNQRIRKVNATTGIITTIAGNGGFGSTGDGAAATAATFYYPSGVALDTAGNIYIVDQSNHKIRKVTVSSGNITTVAGNGTAAFSGDGGLATAASLNEPSDVAILPSGDMIIADRYNNRVRKVNFTTGIITTIAGTGTSGSSGDGGAATAAQLYWPSGVTFDATGNIYIADLNNNKIRKISSSTGVISTIAGTGSAGYSGDGSSATSAKINTPTDIAIDPSGMPFFVDRSNNRIRKIGGTSGIESLSLKLSFHISPNPFSVQTTLSLDNELKNVSFTLLNNFGQKVKEIGALNGSSLVIQRDNLPSGLYFIQAQQADKTILLEKILITDK